MKKSTRLIAALLTAAMLITCSAAAAEAPRSTVAKIDSTKWRYNADDDVYWQTGVSYCAKPVSEYESLGVFVPAAYMTARDNGDGTYTCTVNTSGSTGGYTAQTAPVVLPVNTPGYMAMKAPSSYVSGAAEYTKAGFVYVSAGCRGRDEGAPAGVTDLKAAVRYLRYLDGAIPGDTQRIFTFGMSGGGAQSALMGATGDSALYTPYLNAIGAVRGVSDAVAGSMCWCPITNLDYANEAYEWNMGLTRDNLDGQTQALSDGMAQAFAEYLNQLGLRGADGGVLTLEESDTGVYMAGSYVDELKSVIERSLNNFLADTAFPYTPQSMGPGPGRMEDGIVRREMKRAETSVTYQTAEDYIDSLNQTTEWVLYDSAANTAAITSVADFVRTCKSASKSVGAFDALDASQGENTLFGYGDGEGAHFDPVLAGLLADNASYAHDFAVDLNRTDATGKTVDYRMNMYNPLYYLNDYYSGYRSSNVAQYWRIRSGINQGDTALTTELNLALALEEYGAQVDFETVWGLGHVEAERTGSSTENFISWVNDCLENA